MRKSRRGADLPRLTPAQRTLVRNNIGLVGVHLRRHVTNLAYCRRDREYDDLFQEGCLGLMQAAVRWDAASGIPFAAFALPRIHNAISTALRCKFSMVYVPPRYVSKRGAANSGANGTYGARPRECSLSESLRFELTETPAGEQAAGDGETIGDRVRDKYERAVQSAVETLRRRTSARGDRDELLRVLVRERLLVPDEESRRPLRQIARETKSSYARVAQSGAQLAELVKSALAGDPEFGELLRLARVQPEGFASIIDERIERALGEVSAREYARRFEHADDTDRARLVYSLMRRTHFDVAGFVRDGFGRLDRQQRESMLHDPVGRGPSRRAGAHRLSA